MGQLYSLGSAPTYRPYCDQCGEKIVPYPLTLGQARKVADAHCRSRRHEVRVEPWAAFNLVELVEWAKVMADFDRPTRDESEAP